MAATFNIFRQYQRSALAALAIMAMLAFFVLPPLLQMNADSGRQGDPLVVAWAGGGLRESDLQRQMYRRRALNEFLVALQFAATGDPRVRPPLPMDERSVVETRLLASEAAASGLVISNEVVNDVIKRITGNVVTTDRINEIMASLRGVTATDLFESLRELIAAERMERLVVRGADFAALPPGWQWDAFRRLEQEVTIEVVPVAVEAFLGDTPQPTRQQLEDLYGEHRDELPDDRSPTPGFREPARARYEGVVARADLFLAEAEQAVTEEQIGKFYEENRDRLYLKQPAASGEPATPSGGGDKPADAKPADAKPADAKPADAKPADAKPAAPPANNGAATAADPEPPGEDVVAPAPPAPAEQPSAPGPDQPAAPGPDAGADVSPAGIDSGGSRVNARLVSFRQPAVDEAPPTAKTPAAAAEPPAAAEPASSGDAKPAPAQPASASAAGAAAGQAPPVGSATDTPPAVPTAPAEYEPLEAVRDSIRKELAREAVAKRLQAAFEDVARRISKYSEDLDLAIALEQPVPQPPDITEIARQHGLEVLRSEFVSPVEAEAAGGIGQSFDFAISQDFGFRQQAWIDMVLAEAAPEWRPVESRDRDGNRYLSWKIEQRPEFTPPLAEIRPRVEQAWRLSEARPRARKRAEEIVAAAAGKSLAEAVANQAGLAAATVGPFTWLTRGTAPFGSPPALSQPEGLVMPDEEFMRQVFALEPGETAVAFNEPQTICYAVRVTGFGPSQDVLESRFVDAARDPRRLAMLAAEDMQAVRDRWVAGIERRRGVEWKRPPQ